MLALALLAPALAARAGVPEVKFPVTFTTTLTPGRIYTFTLSIWTARTGGTQVGGWSETLVRLPVGSDKAVHYVLGTKRALPVLDYAQQYWVQLQTGAAKFRTRLPAAGYAFWSARVATIADGQVTAAKVGSGTALAGMVLSADGGGGAGWQSPASGGIAEIIAGNGLGGGGATSPVTLELAVPVAVADGGTGATDAPGARASLGAAASGANADITSLGGLTTPLSITQGGTGSGSKNFVDLTTDQTLAGVKTFSARILSSVGAGTAPLAVASDTLVGNFNADQLDGYHATYFAAGLHTHDTPYWRLGGNTGTTGSDFVGTGDNQPFEVKVNGARAMRFEPQVWAPNVIAGSSANAVRSGASVGGGISNTAAGLESTVAGGYQNEASATAAFVGGGEQNRAYGNRAAVAGGQSNQAGANYAFIGGGDANTVYAQYAAIGGGQSNTADGRKATVSGGSFNLAGNTGATVAGGSSNSASGSHATVGGGQYNQAGGDYSFAAGYRAKVRDAIAAGDDEGDEGSFVWADYADADFVSTGPRQFLVRAAGGVGINTNAPAAGMALDVNGAVQALSFNPTSDRNAKEGFTPVDGREVLAKVVALPVTSWRFRGDPAAVRHLGPVAQDFRAAFGLGYNETTIATVDADGVALAAIQGLNAILEGQRAELAELRARLEAQALLIERLLEKTAAAR